MATASKKIPAWFNKLATYKKTMDRLMKAAKAGKLHTESVALPEIKEALVVQHVMLSSIGGGVIEIRNSVDAIAADLKARRSKKRM